jgi:hypothetical protein
MSCCHIFHLGTMSCISFRDYVIVLYIVLCSVCMMDYVIHELCHV